MMKNGIDSAAVEGVENMEYEVPNVAVEYVRIDTPVPGRVLAFRGKLA